MLWLPVEVLSQILQHALRTTKNPSGVVVARESPLFLAHICSHWRFTAFSIPDIWSFIDVSVTMATTSHIHNRTELLQLHLSLSKGAPLSIALVSDSKDQDSDIIQPFIHTLVPHFPRCRSLYMDLPYSSLIALDRLVTPQSFSSLSDITFHGDTPASQQHSFCAFSEAPALSTATIWGSHYSLGYVPFPSSQLTHLDVSLGVDHVFWLLHEASHVTECRIFCLDTQSLAGEYYRGLVAPLTLPHLRSLHISGSDSGGFLLNLITTPVLESFSCLLLSIINPLSIIVGTPTTNLTTSPYLLYFIEDLDSKLQNLRELRIEDWSEPIDDVLRGHVLPSLETLTIRLSKDPDLQFHDDVLLNIVASKRSIKPLVNIAQIKSITFIDARAGGRLNDESRRRLEEMQKEGLEVGFVESDVEVPWVWSGKARAAEKLRRLELEF